MELSKDKWRHKYTSMKAARVSTLKSRFHDLESEKKAINPVELDVKHHNIVAKGADKNKPTEPPKAFKNKLLSIYRNR